MAKPFFEPEQRRAFWFAATTFLCGLALIAFHSSYAAGAWPSLPHTEKDGFFLYLVLSTTGEFGTSLIVAALLALFFELVIRRREFAEIGDLIKSVKYSNEIV